MKTTAQTIIAILVIVCGVLFAVRGIAMRQDIALIAAFAAMAYAGYRFILPQKCEK